MKIPFLFIGSGVALMLLFVNRLDLALWALALGVLMYSIFGDITRD